MGREEENRWPWRGQAALARPTPIWASGAALGGQHGRSEEHTSELQSLMRLSYAVFCLKKKKTQKCITSYLETRTHQHIHTDSRSTKITQHKQQTQTNF